mmetsp:Transcript_39576/g.59875  ORF Transcript_39576/g.59875 Transcript_39576/m.59875 type:complete len:544 (-) Transcript_39576:149-1780(-)
MSSMRQARRIARDIQEANKLPNIGICCKDDRMDLLFGHIGFESHGQLLRMPVLVQLEKDYPLSPPNVGFPVHFQYHMGATESVRSGDLAGTMSICLDITGNFKHIHTEWSTEKGTGWSPSMTLSSLLVQLQSLLMELKFDEGVHREIVHYKCQVDGENVHSHINPFPPISDANISNTTTETTPSASCYVRGCTESEDVLGYGWKVTGKSQVVFTPAELLSWGAFSEDKVRLSAEKTQFDFFWPRLSSNGTSPHKNIHKVLQVCIENASRALGCRPEKAAAVLTSKLITGVVVEMMKKSDSVRLFDALLDFRRMLQHITSIDDKTKQYIKDRLEYFCGSEVGRHKDACSSLGDLISLYMCAPSQSREEFVDAYLDETSLRSVMWWQKDSVPPISEPVFQATKVSRHLFLFQLKVLDAVNEVGEAGDDASHIERLQETWRSVRDQVEAGGWEEHLKEIGCSEMIRSRILADKNSWIASCVARSAAKGPKYKMSPASGPPKSRGEGGNGRGRGHQPWRGRRFGGRCQGRGRGHFQGGRGAGRAKPW